MPQTAKETGRASAAHGVLVLWIALFAVWLIANGTLAVAVVILGALITGILAVVFAARGGVWTGIRWTLSALSHFLAYLRTFLVELVKANINMMGYVYAPRIDIKPGIVAVRTRLVSPIGRMALANTIALTPGSLVMDLDGDLLFVHCLDVTTTDVDEATAAIAAPFERHLEKVFG